jgi:hypothetical protein
MVPNWPSQKVLLHEPPLTSRCEILLESRLDKADPSFLKENETYSNYCHGSKCQAWMPLPDSSGSSAKSPLQ